MTNTFLFLSYSDIEYYSGPARSGSLRVLVHFRSVLAQNPILSLSFSDIQYHFRHFFAGGASRRQRTLCLCHIRILYIIFGQIFRRRFAPPIRRRQKEKNRLYNVACCAECDTQATWRCVLCAPDCDPFIVLARPYAELWVGRAGVRQAVLAIRGGEGRQDV